MFFSSHHASKLQAPDIILLTTLVCSKFPLPLQSIPLSVNRTPPPLAHDIIKFDNAQIKPGDCPFENAEPNSLSSPFGELRSTSREINSTIKTTPESDRFFPTSEDQVLAREGKSSENLDQMDKDNESNDSLPSETETYFTPEEEEPQFFSEFAVSLVFRVSFTTTLYVFLLRGEMVGKFSNFRTKYKHNYAKCANLAVL